MHHLNVYIILLHIILNKDKKNELGYSYVTDTLLLKNVFKCNLSFCLQIN